MRGKGFGWDAKLNWFMVIMGSYKGEDTNTAS